jgi:hypothetical protein
MAELDQSRIYNVNVTWAGLESEELRLMARLFLIKPPENTIPPSLFRVPRLNLVVRFPACVSGPAFGARGK